MPGIVEGKRILVTGARNKWSIGWATAAALHREGARLAFSVFGEREEGGVSKLIAEAGIAAPIFRCDATDDAQVSALYEQVSEAFDGALDGLVHAIAFANKEELAGEYCATSRDGFRIAQESSVYSLVSLTRGARPLMQNAGGGSVVTLTYIGAERVVPNYNVMGVAKASLEASVRYLASDLGKEGIRVNAISAGPTKTLAASAIKGFDAMLNQVAKLAPLRRKIEVEEVADAALFLLSPLSRGITGEVLYVDGGYHILGMVEPVE
jgi:enoyl-[acyl-carrier protein] reductase I